MKLLSLSVKDPGSDTFTTIKGAGGVPTGGINGPQGLSTLIQNGIVLALIIISLFSLIYLIWGGIGWITSGGDKAKVQAARNKIMYAVIGLIIAFLAFLIVAFIGKLFGVTNFVT